METAPIPINKEKYNKIKSIKVKSNKNREFNITFINKDDYLIIKAKCYNIEYEKSISLDEIKEVKLFKFYESVEECFEEMLISVDSNECFIEDEIDFITLIIPLRNEKYKEIRFTIHKKINEDINQIYNNSNNEFNNNTMSNILNILKSHTEKINKLENENNCLKKELNKLNNLNLEISTLKSKISLLEYKQNLLIKLQKQKNIIKEKNKEQKEKGIQLDSHIINNIKEYKISLKNWINKTSFIKANLLYRLSRDGESFKTFHEKCNNKSPTLIIIESINGQKFGGYTTCTWDGKWTNKFDGQTFLFSLNKNIKFKKKYNLNDNKDIYVDQDCGPWFGRNDLYFEKNMKICYSYKSNQYSFLNDKDLYYNKDDDDIELKEVEIYEIIFE